MVALRWVSVFVLLNRVCSRAWLATGVAGLDVRSQKEYEARKVAQLGGDVSSALLLSTTVLLNPLPTRVPDRTLPMQQPAAVFA